jgi:carboxymethylenebutenolidase
VNRPVLENSHAAPKEDRRPISRRQLFRSMAGVACGGALSALLLKSRAFATASLHANEGPTEIDAGTVQFPSGNFTLKAYVAKPKAAGKYPAVIVIHDEQGLQEHIQNVARRLASAGCFAIAPDLLSRSGGVAKQKDLAAIAEALKNLPVDGTVQDLNSTFAFAQKNPAAISDKVSVVGFGWGGWRTFLFAANQADLRKGVVFCGSTPGDGLEDIQAQFLAHYAQLDFRITGNALWTEKTLNTMGKQFAYYVYDNVDHGFCDESGPEYNAAAAELAWSRTLEFLRA